MVLKYKNYRKHLPIIRRDILFKNYLKITKPMRTKSRAAENTTYLLKFQTVDLSSVFCFMCIQTIS